uniref:Uncharacterized protein n=1 Tax=Octopus bimaculoides TaxID=37653 RepID=A0A0L8I6I3_OCTBM
MKGGCRLNRCPLSKYELCVVYAGVQDLCLSIKMQSYILQVSMNCALFCNIELISNSWPGKFFMEDWN